MIMVHFGRLPFIIKFVIFTLVLLLLLDMALFPDILLSTWRNTREYLNNSLIVSLLDG
ncbi:hypothetical protein AB7W72_21555 [Providencia rettgeri]